MEKILLVDENKINGSALKLYLNKILKKKIIFLTLKKTKDKYKIYDYIILNLCYYNYSSIISIINSIEEYRHTKLIIISNVCYKNFCTYLLKKYNCIILCNYNFPNLRYFNKNELNMYEIKCNMKNFDLNLLNQSNKINFFLLSRQEKNVLKLIGKGMTSNMIAKILYISKRTVDFHRCNLLKKLNCKNRAELIICATFYIQSLHDDSFLNLENLNI